MRDNNLDFEILVASYKYVSNCFDDQNKIE